MTRQWLGLRWVVLWRRKVLLRGRWASCRCMAWTVSTVDVAIGIRRLWGRRTLVPGRLLRWWRRAAIFRWAALIPVLIHHLRRLLWLLRRLLRRRGPSLRIVSRIYRLLVVRGRRVGVVATIVLIWRALTFDIYLLVLRMLWRDGGILRRALRRRPVVGPIDHVRRGRGAMHEHRKLIRWLLSVVASWIWWLWARAISIMIVWIWIAFRGTLAMDRGRRIVIHWSVSLTMTRILVAALMLKE
jgi:hypothetical protein